MEIDRNRRGKVEHTHMVLGIRFGLEHVVKWIGSCRFCERVSSQPARCQSLSRWRRRFSLTFCRPCTAHSFLDIYYFLSVSHPAIVVAEPNITANISRKSSGFQPSRSFVHGTRACPIWQGDTPPEMKPSLGGGRWPLTWALSDLGHRSNLKERALTCPHQMSFYSIRN